jgi:hypothetical protein
VEQSRLRTQVFSLSLWERAGVRAQVFLPLPVGEGRGEGIRLFSLSLWERAGVRASGFSPSPCGRGSG